MYTRLVLSGGSLKGLAYIGVLKRLEELNCVRQITQVVGTSIGALFGLLIILGYDSKTLENFFINFDSSILVNYKLSNFINTYGLDDSTRLVNFIKLFLKAKGFDPKITMKQLHSKTRKAFACGVTKVNTKEDIYVDHLTFPDIPVFLAVRASMSLPFIFEPVKYDGDTYIDGCLTCNLPVKYFKYTGSTEKTLVIFLKDNLHTYTEIYDLKSFIKTLPKCCFSTIETENIRYCEEILKENVISLNICLEDNLNFKISNETKKILISIGYCINL